MLGSRRGPPIDSSDDRQDHLVLPSDRSGEGPLDDLSPDARGGSHLVLHEEGRGRDSAVTPGSEGVEILRSRRGGSRS